jgi:amino-acid N-acetyltransferase
MRNAFAPDAVHDEMHDDPSIVIRKAGMADIHPILKIINSYAAQGIMLPRTEFEMSENIRDFSVAYSGDQLVACGALHFYSPTAAEVRSLAVDPASKNRGLGRLMVQALEREAISYSLHSIFAFTYVEKFFGKLGFHRVERGILPLKVWKDCVRCSKFECCDETAVLKYLIEHPVPETYSLQQDEAFVQLPVLKIASSSPSRG